MNYIEFKEKLFDLARKEGFQEFEVYYQVSEDLEVNAYNKEIDKYDLNSSAGISFRGIYNGKMGSSYTEILDEESLDLVIKTAKSNSIVIDSLDVTPIFAGSESYNKINNFNEKLNDFTAKDCIDGALKIEEHLKTKSLEVVNTLNCVVAKSSVLIKISNSKGLELEDAKNMLVAYAVPVLKRDEQTKVGMDFKFTNKLEELNVERIAENAIENGARAFGAESINSGKYRVILENVASSSLLSSFTEIFSADNVQKNMSLLKGKIGEQIASEKFSLVDDPFVEGSIYSCSFDAEGVATYKKDIIKKGILKTHLHNLKTAIKENVTSTGNASKSSYASTIEIEPSNICVEPSNISFEELLIKLGNGVVITELEGLHAGVNSVSGDFSLAANGFLVQNGKIVKAVEQITVSGNYYTLMKDVEEVGSDVKTYFPMGFLCYSPSILIKELSIAGK